MCSCEKFGDEAFYEGCRRGIYEVHTSDYCTTRDLNTWRTRLFVPIAEFFDRLAGAFSSSQIAVVDMDRRRHRNRLIDERRRVALEQAMAGQSTQPSSEEPQA